MGSYCGISFDRLSVFDSKSYVPDDWSSLFQESDRRDEMRRHPGAGEDEDLEQFTEYVADRSTILRRLALLGVTREVAQSAFEAWLEDERQTWAEYVESWNAQPGDRAQVIASGLSTMDRAAWEERARAAIESRFEFDKDESKDPITEQFHRLDDSYLFVGGYGSLVSLRVLLEACPSVEDVRLDVSDLIQGGYYEEGSRIVEDARLHAPHQLEPLSPTVILGEGSSDLLVLRLALDAMHPALIDYFTFFNHSELSVDGGAIYLVKFLKAFAAARAPSRMLAIFDNDTAGTLAYEQAKRLSLPSNIIVTKLPDSELGRRYPTIGPGGYAELDVNGQAASIELYLGREILTNGAELRPVRWGGYVPSAGKYQGEIEGKASVVDAFKKRLAAIRDPDQARAEFPDLARVWQHIFDLVEHQAGEAYLRSYERLREEF